SRRSLLHGRGPQAAQEPGSVAAHVGHAAQPQPHSAAQPTRGDTVSVPRAPGSKALLVYLVAERRILPGLATSTNEGQCFRASRFRVVSPALSRRLTTWHSPPPESWHSPPCRRRETDCETRRCQRGQWR